MGNAFSNCNGSSAFSSREAISSIKAILLIRNLSWMLRCVSKRLAISVNKSCSYLPGSYGYLCFQATYGVRSYDTERPMNSSNHFIPLSTISVMIISSSTCGTDQWALWWTAALQWRHLTSRRYTNWEPIRACLFGVPQASPIRLRYLWLWCCVSWRGATQ